MAFALPLVPAWVRKSFQNNHSQLAREVMGLKFPNPVGLAAGFDKDARLIDELACFGFGHIEIGTLTPVAQPGNPKPRLFRLPADAALINRMGFNNGGVADAAQRLRQRKSKVIVGGNIGKNKDTPNEHALDDYLKAFEHLHPYVDYFVVNVSSPNTPGLRDLQDKEPLTRILNALQERNRQMSVRRPILLKIAPDLTQSQLDDIIDIVKQTEIQGVIATNTTINRSQLRTADAELESIGAGGLSGSPLKNRATEVIRYLYQQSGGSFVIIGVGGVYTAADVIEKLEAGASLVQLYTGFVYEGPSAVKRINKELVKYFSQKAQGAPK
jgi:dihydroorotate dehydrogenase